jgi:hypothetical protein
VGDAASEFAATDSHTPSFPSQAEIELAPYCETAQGDSGQPRSATNLLSFPHLHASSLYRNLLKPLHPFNRCAQFKSLQEIEPTIQLRDARRVFAATSTPATVFGQRSSTDYSFEPSECSVNYDLLACF